MTTVHISEFTCTLKIPHKQTLGLSVKCMKVTQLVLAHETCIVLCKLQTMDYTCMLACTITCAKQVKIWPIPRHRVAYDFMHIATKMHESHMVRI